MADEPEKEVGYKKPPRKSRFKPGQSGNPKGRPKGSQNQRTLLEKELMQKVTVTEYGKKRKITKGHAVAKRTVEQAMNGNEKSQDLIFRLTSHTASQTPDAAPSSTEGDQAIIDSFEEKRNRE